MIYTPINIIVDAGILKPVRIAAPSIVHLGGSGKAKMQVKILFFTFVMCLHCCNKKDVNKLPKEKSGTLKTIEKQLKNIPTKKQLEKVEKRLAGIEDRLKKNVESTKKIIEAASKIQLKLKQLATDLDSTADSIKAVKGCIDNAIVLTALITDRISGKRIDVKSIKSLKTKNLSCLSKEEMEKYEKYAVYLPKRVPTRKPRTKELIITDKHRKDIADCHDRCKKDIADYYRRYTGKSINDPIEIKLALSKGTVLSLHIDNPKHWPRSFTNCLLQKSRQWIFNQRKSEPISFTSFSFMMKRTHGP